MALSRVVYWNNIPAPYMVDRFNALAARGNLDFEAWFSERHGAGRSWSVEEDTWQFKHRYVKRIGRRKSFAVPPASLLLDPPDLLITLHAHPECLAGWAMVSARGAKTAFWVEVTFDSWIRRSRWKEDLKPWIFRHTDALVTAGNDGVDWARGYGVSSDKTFVLPHVIDVDHFSQARALSLAQRSAARAELGIDDADVTFIYVGRFWRKKGVIDLIDAFSEVSRVIEPTPSLLLVGDGPDEDLIRRAIAATGLATVKIVPFVQKGGLPRVYAAADVFVFPTHGDPYGMVVDEAMMAGLPVISTTAAGEITSRVTEGVNGFLVPPSDPQKLAAAMIRIGKNAEERRRMGAAAADALRHRTTNYWAAEFERFVAGLL